MIVALDTETYPIIPGLSAPPLVCVSFATQHQDTTATDLKDHVEGLDEVEALLKDPNVTIVGHHVSYDFAVMCAERPSLIPLVFKAYADGRIRDTQLRETLIAIAMGLMPRDDKGRKGMFTLDTIAAKRCGITLIKDDSVRLDYARFRGTPIEQYPEAYSRYAVEDARATLAVYLAQAEAADDYREQIEPHAVKTEPHECRSAFALELMRCWGLRTDKVAIDVLEVEFKAQFETVDQIVRTAGIVRANGTEDQKALRALVVEAYSGNAPMTKANKSGKGGGNVATDADTLKDSGHPVLVARSERKSLEKLLTTFVPVLRQGQTVPVNPGWNTLVTTTRTSCSKPNMQQPPKTGGVRECFVARPGYVFCSVDYDTIELKALSYFCESTFGYSAMADAIRTGADIHTRFAARMLGLEYSDAVANKKRPDVKRARDVAKAFNFGLPGGMGVERFQEHAHGQGLDFSIFEIERFKALWLEEWPEMREFFAYVGRLTGRGNKVAITAPGLGVVLGDRGFCDACNAHFQVPVAVGAKRALFDVQRECYTGLRPDGMPSPLAGSRMALFIHDELVPELLESKAHEAAFRVSEIMIAAMQPLFPTVPITCLPALMRRLSKAADTVYNEQGLLIPYEDAATLKKAA